MTNKIHLVFLKQLITAFIFFLALSLSVNFLFLEDANVSKYSSLNKGVEEMALSKEELLESLLKNNEVTFDPSNGKNIDVVLSNLKQVDKPKLLIIGSSQMIVIQGDKEVGAYQKIVSQKLSLFSGVDREVYNLSLGGMTTSEKILIARKAVNILAPERVILTATPWDSAADDVRLELVKIEDKQYEANFSKENTSLEEPFIFPLTFNDKIDNITEGFLKRNVQVYSRRIGLKYWLENTFNELGRSKRELEKGKVVLSEVPEYWQTQSQELTDETGWDDSIVKSGKKSVAIKTSSKSTAQWMGNDIHLKNPSKKLFVEAWSKAEKVSDSTKFYCVYLGVRFEDGTQQQIYKNLNFKKGTHDWERVYDTLSFGKRVTSIRPFLMLHGGTGSVWFDDISIENLENSQSEQIIPNGGFEEQTEDRKYVSYLYNDKQWETIFKNMSMLVDFISENTMEPGALLITPVWNKGNNYGYPQQESYEKLISAISSYSNAKGVVLLDATNVLDSGNFGSYTSGKDTDKTDVLHFDEAGHIILAKYIANQLGL